MSQSNKVIHDGGAASRVRPASLLAEADRLMVIALDHPARGALRAGPRALAMADRRDLLDRLGVALSTSLE